MTKPKISIIVPVYNTQEYLKQCLDSITAQTYQNLEIILADDGSTDDSPQICDDYAEKDSRIQVLHLQNGGASAARNAGLDIAKGEFIAFCDSDDWIEPFLCERLMDCALQTGAEICQIGSAREWEDHFKVVSEASETRVFTVYAMKHSRELKEHRATAKEMREFLAQHKDLIRKQTSWKRTVILLYAYVWFSLSA